MISLIIASGLSANWYIGNTSVGNKYPIDDSKLKSTEHGGDINAITAYSVS